MEQFLSSKPKKFRFNLSENVTAKSMPHQSLTEQYRKDQQSAMELIRQVDALTGLVPEYNLVAVGWIDALRDLQQRGFRNISGIGDARLAAWLCEALRVWLGAEWCYQFNDGGLHAYQDWADESDIASGVARRGLRVKDIFFEDPLSWLRRGEADPACPAYSYLVEVVDPVLPLGMLEERYEKGTGVFRYRLGQVGLKKLEYDYDIDNPDTYADLVFRCMVGRHVHAGERKVVPESWDRRSYEAFREAVKALGTDDIRALDTIDKSIRSDAPAYRNMRIVNGLCTLPTSSIYGLLIPFRRKDRAGDPFAEKNMALLRGEASPGDYTMPPDSYLYEAIDYAGIPRNFYDLGPYLYLESDDKAAIRNLKAMQADFVEKKDRGDNVVDVG